MGQGTYSTVYAVRDDATGAVRALKKVRLDTGDADAVAFAAREVRRRLGAAVAPRVYLQLLSRARADSCAQKHVAPARSLRRSTRCAA